jgi:hypothetical protein
MARGGRAARVERAGNQGGFFEAAALKAADQPAGLRGPAAIECAAGIVAGAGVGPPVPPHQKVERMRGPAAPVRAQALPVERCGEPGIGGHPGPAKFVEEEAQMGRTVGAVHLVLILRPELAAALGGGWIWLCGGPQAGPAITQNMGTAEEICQAETPPGQAAFFLLLGTSKRTGGRLETPARFEHKSAAQRRPAGSLASET